MNSITINGGTVRAKNRDIAVSANRSITLGAAQIITPAGGRVVKGNGEVYITNAHGSYATEVVIGKIASAESGHTHYRCLAGADETIRLGEAFEAKVDAPAADFANIVSIKADAPVIAKEN